ncbi:dolichyl-phosphate-mannose--protein mannosyltransferase [Nocardiopsis composta]|uniref:Polyprenol-phosphate-mannose--protein mannosyltransferase n=1 Tax=Nocardiopsis composta TaxID=157465 RepID=A0A7W8QR73_9ACTN|nr:phospholipid carrier-dependent glycosyltransferase [Nocardiopsis composta]MBB5434445.1 hypothetical protein [Nocardiopsis composta]
MTSTAPPYRAEHAAPSPPAEPARPHLPPMPTPAWAGWAGAVLLAVFAGVLRFIRLGEPPSIYFDETYYAKDAYSLLEFGYEHETLENADDLLARGGRDLWTGGADFVVHPPAGKWMIALGDWLWGLTPFGTSMTPEGWRVAAALFGALSVLVLVRVAVRMTRSWLLGCAAGLLLALDGLHFTMSRIAMVDVFLTFWVLAGFACLLVDRDRMRERLLADPTAAWLGVRWWRLAAGLCFGLAVGTKWSALFFIAAFGLLTVAWDFGARRSAGQRGDGGGRWSSILTGRAPEGGAAAGRETLLAVRTAALLVLCALVGAALAVLVWAALGAGPAAVAAVLLVLSAVGLAFALRRSLLLRCWLLFDAVPAFLQTVVVAAGVYLASWAGWFATAGGYGRQYGAEHPLPALERLPDWLSGPIDAVRGLAVYHSQMMQFHSTLDAPHDYASRPWEWIVMRTPVAFFYEGDQTGCGAAKCSSAILAIGTPVLWWLSVAALVVMAGWWLVYRDWRAGAVLLAVAAGWLPWFAYPDRTMFVFYALPFLPFLVLAMVLALGLAMGDDGAGPDYLPGRRIFGGIVFGVVMLLVIIDFAYMYPVLSAELMPYEAWRERMWFETWIFGNAGGE